MNVDTSHRHFLLASLPAAAVGIYNLGVQIRAVAGGQAGAWQLALLDWLGIGEAASSTYAAVATGTMFWLPLLAVALAVSFAWAKLFARSSGGPIDSGWLSAAWLFALMLPATSPIVLAALALSFGLVFGCHAFGGTGRYLVNPALLAVVFLGIGYPALTAPDALVPGGSTLSTWALVAMTGVDVARLQGIEITTVLAGGQIGAIGTPSAIACLLGAVYLIAVRAAAAPVVVGGLLGLIAASAAGPDVAWPWQLALGNFAFGLAFIATDPTTRPTTPIGRWSYGALFGVLTVVLRTANPAHPEGTWAALLLASLCVPLIDKVVCALRRPAPAGSDA